MTIGRQIARTLLVALAATLAVGLCGAPAARAGGGPENVFLVVNSTSWASQTVANHFIKLRQIPTYNVFYVDWVGGFESVEGTEFREKILRPTFEAIERRGLLAQIDYIIYSSDFPYAVDLTQDFAGIKLPSSARPGLSINSATFLWHFAATKNPRVMAINANHYFRASRDGKLLPSHGFRSWYGWGPSGELIDAGGQPYMLSTLLAMTSGRGNSVREAVDCLTRSAKADGTRPKGTIYYCKTDDVRSTKRAPLFDTAVAELAKLGVRAEVVSTSMPVGRADVAGAMTGVADFSWPRTRSTILPGAICENFTSFGGSLTETAIQTPLTEFLRYGAAGSSGTVIEPFALEQKFPAPLVQVHYARGCTLAESFYQSVSAPAQLLIVGDPLCRPWANIPIVNVDGVTPSARLSGKVILKPTATLPQAGTIDRFEMYVDGRRTLSTRPGGQFEWDTTLEPDGWHELRVVAIEAGPIESQGRLIMPVVLTNHKLTAQLSTVPSNTVRWDQQLKVQVAAPGASQIIIIHNTRVLGRIEGEKGEIELNPRAFGSGPVTLEAVCISSTPPGNRVWANPVHLTIEPNSPIAPLANPPQTLVRGLVLRLPDGKVVPVQDTSDPAWLTLNGIRGNQPFTLQGFVDIPAPDVYQFQIAHYGDVKVTLDGRPLYAAEQGDYKTRYVAEALAPGIHRLTVSGTTGQDPKLRIHFGGPGSTTLKGATFRHAR